MKLTARVAIKNMGRQQKVLRAEATRMAEADLADLYKERKLGSGILRISEGQTSLAQMAKVGVGFWRGAVWR